MIGAAILFVGGAAVGYLAGVFHVVIRRARADDWRLGAAVERERSPCMAEAAREVDAIVPSPQPTELPHVPPIPALSPERFVIAGVEMPDSTSEKWELVTGWDFYRYVLPNPPTTIHPSGALYVDGVCVNRSDQETGRRYYEAIDRGLRLTDEARKRGALESLRKIGATP